MAYSLEDKINFFVSIAPYGIESSQKSGLSFELALAQIAVETGWGEKIIPGTNNVFNIKAHSSWEGETVTVQTGEVIDGKRVTESGTFRAYDSIEDSFEDRTQFLTENPRYSALFEPENLGNPIREAQILKEARFATEPAYADLLIEVMQGPTMRRVLEAIEDSITDDDTEPPPSSNDNDGNDNVLSETRVSITPVDSNEGSSAIVYPIGEGPTNDIGQLTIEYTKHPSMPWLDSPWINEWNSAAPRPVTLDDIVNGLNASSTSTPSDGSDTTTNDQATTSTEPSDHPTSRILSGLSDVASLASITTDDPTIDIPTLDDIVNGLNALKAPTDNSGIPVAADTVTAKEPTRKKTGDSDGGSGGSSSSGGSNSDNDTSDNYGHGVTGNDNSGSGYGSSSHKDAHNFPIALDLDGDGVELVGVNDSTAAYDFSEDGYRQHTGWVNADDALLAIDLNNDGLIAGKYELAFAEWGEVAIDEQNIAAHDFNHDGEVTLADFDTDGNGLINDLEGLRYFDSNQDGQISQLDNAWDQLRVWQDHNQDGISDGGELSTLDSVTGLQGRGIQSISLDSDQQVNEQDGNITYGQGHYTLDDNSQQNLADVAFRNSGLGLQDNQDGTTNYKLFTQDGVEQNLLALDETTQDQHLADISTDQTHYTGMIGNAQANTLTAGQGQSAILSGEGGDDTLLGSAQKDVLLGGDGQDTLQGGLGRTEEGASSHPANPSPGRRKYVPMGLASASLPQTPVLRLAVRLPIDWCVVQGCFLPVINDEIMSDSHNSTLKQVA